MRDCKLFHLVRADFEPDGLDLTLLLVSIFCTANKTPACHCSLGLVPCITLLQLAFSVRPPPLTRPHSTAISPDSTHAKVIWLLSSPQLPVELLILPSATHPVVCLHLKQTTHSLVPCQCDLPSAALALHTHTHTRCCWPECFHEHTQPSGHFIG